MRKFIKEALSERGEASAKRLTLAWSAALFTLVVLCNLWDVKRQLTATLGDQVFYVLIASLGAVAGVGMYNKYADIKMKQSDNNKSVGEPSPPPDIVK